MSLCVINRPPRLARSRSRGDRRSRSRPRPRCPTWARARLGGNDFCQSSAVFSLESRDSLQRIVYWLVLGSSSDSSSKYGTVLKLWLIGS